MFALQAHLRDLQVELEAFETQRLSDGSIDASAYINSLLLVHHSLVMQRDKIFCKYFLSLSVEQRSDVGFGGSLA